MARKRNLRNASPILIIVAIILAILAGLYINAGHMRREQLEVVAVYQGNDEMSPAIRAEADSFAHANRNQQRIILGVGAVIIAVTAVWWISGRMRRD